MAHVGPDDRCALARYAAPVVRRELRDAPAVVVALAHHLRSRSADPRRGRRPRAPGDRPPAGEDPQAEVGVLRSGHPDVEPSQHHQVVAPEQSRVVQPRIVQVAGTLEGTAGSPEPLTDGPLGQRDPCCSVTLSRLERPPRWLSGGRIMSLSSHRNHAPVAMSKPVLRWALRSGPAVTTTSAIRRAISTVPSVLELSTTISSTEGCSDRARTSGTPRSSVGCCVSGRPH